MDLQENIPILEYCPLVVILISNKITYKEVISALFMQEKNKTKNLHNFLLKVFLGAIFALEEIHY